MATITRAAAGDGSVPPDLLGRLLEQVGMLQRQVLAPRGLTFSGLTERETTILVALARGLSNEEAGRIVQLDRRTVRTHLGHIYQKLGVRSHVEAVVRALKLGLIEL